MGLMRRIKAEQWASNWNDQNAAFKEREQAYNQAVQNLRRYHQSVADDRNKAAEYGLPAPVDNIDHREMLEDQVKRTHISNTERRAYDQARAIANRHPEGVDGASRAHMYMKRNERWHQQNAGATDSSDSALWLHNAQRPGNYMDALNLQDDAQLASFTSQGRQHDFTTNENNLNRKQQYRIFREGLTNANSQADINRMHEMVKMGVQQGFYTINQQKDFENRMTLQSQALEDQKNFHTWRADDDNTRAAISSLADLWDKREKLRSDFERDVELYEKIKSGEFRTGKWDLWSAFGRTWNEVDSNNLDQAGMERARDTIRKIWGETRATDLDFEKALQIHASSKSEREFNMRMLELYITSTARDIGKLMVHYEGKSQDDVEKLMPYAYEKLSTIDFDRAVNALSDDVLTGTAKGSAASGDDDDDDDKKSGSILSYIIGGR